MTKEEKEKMFLDNEKLIWYVISKYYGNRPSQYDDLYQIGAMVLWKCIMSYDSSKGTLSTYAVDSMKAHMKTYLLNKNAMFSSCNSKIYKLVCFLTKYMGEGKGEKEIWKIVKVPIKAK